MLDHTKLVNVRERGGKIIAQCPACAEAGHDRRKEHLFIAEDGRFGCVAYPGDHDHRSRIFALAGDRAQRSVVVRVTAQKAVGAVEKGVLGRLGRVFNSLALGQKENAQGQDVVEQVCIKDYRGGVPAVPNGTTTATPGFDLVAVARLLFNAVEVPDDDLDDNMRERLAMIEAILAQRDHKGRINYTASEIEACAIGLRRHAGTHPDIDAMLHRLNEAAALALGWRELVRRWRG